MYYNNEGVSSQLHAYYTNIHVRVVKTYKVSILNDNKL